MYQHYQRKQGKLIYKVLFFRLACLTTLDWKDQQLWNDINFGESEADKDHKLLELETECLEVYRPKVEEAGNAKVRLHSLLQPKKLNLPLSWLNTSIRILGLLWTW